MAKTSKPRASEVPATEVETLRHPADVTRRNIPTAETSALMAAEEAAARPMLYPRNPDLDPQLVWRGKDAQDAAPLSVETVPIYIQEKVLPEALIRDLRRQSRQGTEPQADLFGGFDRIADAETKLEFYAHAENWSNRMILGDSLLVMNSLAEKEGLRGQVQMIYLDPPYGIRFASNWQPSTRTREVKEGKLASLSRQPEQIKAFRDTWKDGINSYLSFWRDRLFIARELLAETGSIFVQISDENVHHLKSLLEEVFGGPNFVSMISFRKTTTQAGDFLPDTNDYILWFSKSKDRLTPRQLYFARKGYDWVNYDYVETGDGQARRITNSEKKGNQELQADEKVFRRSPLTSASRSDATSNPFIFQGSSFHPGAGGWKSNEAGLTRLGRAGRLLSYGSTLAYKRYAHDFPYVPLSNSWSDTASGGYGDEKVYVVQTNSKVVERCMLLSTDAGDIVLDPTCGSGTTSLVAELWGRRWITIDTSRVALALARTRLTAARHPANLLLDTKEGAIKEAEVSGTVSTESSFSGDVRQGFVTARASHVTLKSICQNVEVDLIDERWKPTLDEMKAKLSGAIGRTMTDWEIDGLLPASIPSVALSLLGSYRLALRTRQTEMELSIQRNAEIEVLRDQPYSKKGVVRVTGPFTVESLSPHRVLPTHEEDEALLEGLAELSGEPAPPRRHLRSKPDGSDDFVRAVLDNLQKAGVQNTRKNERLTFATLRPWPGQGYVSAEGTYTEGDTPRRAGIAIGPEYGTVGPDFVRKAAQECRDWADALIVCGFAFDPLVGETTMSFGRLTILKARMSQELHAADAYKAGGGNLFTVFGEPDIALDPQPDGRFIVHLRGVDIFDPTTGEVRTTGNVKDDVACWFIDTDYDADSFFVRHAYFLGGKDPFEKLKSALQADIDPDAWASLYKTESRPFPKPKSGRIAVKVINHYGDEAMKVFKIS